MPPVRQALQRLEDGAFAPDRRYPRARRALRIAILAVRGFLRDEGFHYASALAFDTVLSFVPLLVLVIGVLRGLGAYEAFVRTTIQPWIDQTFGASPAGQVTLREAFVQVLDLGAGADLQALGIVGFVVLLYLVVILLTTVETTLNRIWGARRPRSLVRRAVDYAAILFVLPLGLFLATAVGTSAGDLGFLGPLRSVARQAVAIAAASSVLTFLYLVMPSARIRVASAVLGGVLAGVLWHFGLVAYATFQIGVVRYNILYSGFATLPLFLVWIFVSWLVVLFGAEVAAAHQDEGAFRWRVRHTDPSASTRRQLGLHFAARITEAFVAGDAPPKLSELARAAAVPERLAEAVLADLVRPGLFLRAERDGEAAYVSARDPERVRLSRLFDALDHTEDPALLDREAPDPDRRRLDELLTRLERSVRDAPANLTLAELARWLGERRSRPDADEEE
jgi:membrane protein